MAFIYYISQSFKYFLFLVSVLFVFNSQADSHLQLSCTQTPFGIIRIKDENAYAELLKNILEGAEAKIKENLGNKNLYFLKFGAENIGGIKNIKYENLEVDIKSVEPSHREDTQLIAAIKEFQKKEKYQRHFPEHLIDRIVNSNTANMTIMKVKAEVPNVNFKAKIHVGPDANPIDIPVIASTNQKSPPELEWYFVEDRNSGEMGVLLSNVKFKPGDIHLEINNNFDINSAAKIFDGLKQSINKINSSNNPSGRTIKNMIFKDYNINEELIRKINSPEYELKDGMSLDLKKEIMSSKAYFIEKLRRGKVEELRREKNKDKLSEVELQKSNAELIKLNRKLLQIPMESQYSNIYINSIARTYKIDHNTAQTFIEFEDFIYSGGQSEAFNNILINSFQIESVVPLINKKISEIPHQFSQRIDLQESANLTKVTGMGQTISALLATHTGLQILTHRDQMSENHNKNSQNINKTTLINPNILLQDILNGNYKSYNFTDDQLMMAITNKIRDQEAFQLESRSNTKLFYKNTPDKPHLESLGEVDFKTYLDQFDEIDPKAGIGLLKALSGEFNDFKGKFEYYNKSYLEDSSNNKKIKISNSEPLSYNKVKFDELIQKIHDMISEKIEHLKKKESKEDNVRLSYALEAINEGNHYLGKNLFLEIKSSSNQNEKCDFKYINTCQIPDPPEKFDEDILITFDPKNLLASIIQNFISSQILQICESKSGLPKDCKPETAVKIISIKDISFEPLIDGNTGYNVNVKLSATLNDFKGKIVGKDQNLNVNLRVLIDANKMATPHTVKKNKNIKNLDSESKQHYDLWVKMDRLNVELEGTYRAKIANKAAAIYNLLSPGRDIPTPTSEVQGKIDQHALRAESLKELPLGLNPTRVTIAPSGALSIFMNVESK